MDERTFTLLYKSTLRPHVEFANSVWCPYKIGDSKEIEKIQKRATKISYSLLFKVESMVDLGVRFDYNLTFRDHISEKN